MWRTRPERTMSGVVRGMAESSVPVGSWLWRGESGRNELLRGPFALFGVRNSAKLVRNLAKHRRTPMSPTQLIPPTSPGPGFRRGRKTQAKVFAHRTWSAPAADCLQPQLNLHDQVSLARPASSSFWSDIRIPSFAWYQVSPPWKNTE